MNENEVNKKNNDSKKITFTLILVLVLMVTTTGGTYAYFALSATNSTTVTGTAATASLQLTVSEKAPNGKTSTGVLVPQLETYLGSAMNGTNLCVDGNTNIVCKVYEIKIENKSSAAVKLDGYITFAHSADVISNGSLATKAMPNLKWRRTTNATTLGSNTTQDASVITRQSLISNVSLAKTNGSQTYYIVIWINETNSAQNDNGTFTATIEFEGDDGRGITSTIRS